MGIDVIKNIKLCIDGALPLISAVCEKIRLPEIINDKINDQSNRILSTGNAVKAIVMNIIAGRKPMYKLSEFYKDTDTEKLFGEEITNENLTDDTMARALDEIYEIGSKKIMTEIGMSIINE